ncbi:hypothetical protein BKA69DRAFT_1125492 [Paraphysoderma sedebokerense]|nr:hypothetical protein BKA69DRAFT_1125492 [Paraphysoderma sedebokerense]
MNSLAILCIFAVFLSCNALPPVRKSIEDLTPEEKQKFVELLRKLNEKATECCTSMCASPPFSAHKDSLRRARQNPNDPTSNAASCSDSRFKDIETCEEHLYRSAMKEFIRNSRKTEGDQRIPYWDWNFCPAVDKSDRSGDSRQPELQIDMDEDQVGSSRKRKPDDMDEDQAGSSRKQKIDEMDEQ